MKRAASPILLGLMAIALPACIAAPDAPIQEVIPATDTAAPPTATIVWFPPSETPTPQSVPTFQPTPDRKPGIGKSLLTDDFSSSRLWNPGASKDATIDVSHNRLTIAVQPGVSAFRLRQGPVLTNFYAEVTARPSLCRDADEYGLLFRAPNNVAFYSLTLSCNGTARAERVRFGRSYPLQAAIPSADVPVGAPGEVRLGVWVSGWDMRFFLNGRYQFSVTDPSYASGTLGVFAHSTGATPVTVIFSDLSVYNVTYLSPTLTPRP